MSNDLVQIRFNGHVITMTAGRWVDFIGKEQVVRHFEKGRASVLLLDEDEPAEVRDAK